MSNAISSSLVHNPLKLIQDNGEVDVETTRNFLELSRQELASAFGFSADQIRPERMSEKVKERLSQLATAIELVAEALDSDPQKTRYWLKTPNPNFGGISPRSLILRGRANKLMQFIFSAKNASARA